MKLCPSAGGFAEPPRIVFVRPAFGLGTKVVTGCVIVPTPRSVGVPPTGVAVAVNELVTLVPEVKVDEGRSR